MISLQDEISKFQKLVYNPQLAEFVTVDQMFMGGGITMESIIQESNFIVEQLKKMNAVFRNYCKLNEKVYAKITQHQLSVHSQQARLNALVSSVDRKLEQALKKIKEIHQDTLVHNQKSQTIIIEVVDPIRKELEQKVDLSTFTAQMKKFLEEYDDGQAAQGEMEGGVGAITGGQGIASDGAPNSPYPRKKGKVGYDQFYRFRDQLDSKLKLSDNQIVSLESSGSQTKELILKYIPQINNLSHDVAETKTNIYNLGIAQTDQMAQLNSSINKLSNELNARLNEQVWNSKFDSFNEKHVRPLALRLEESLRVIENKIVVNKQESVGRFKEVEAEITKNVTAISLLKRDIAKHKDEIDSLDKTIKKHWQLFESQNFKLSKDIEVVSQDTKRLIEALRKTSEDEFKAIHDKLANLVQTAEESISKAVNKRFDMQLKAIEKDIRANGQQIKFIKEEIGLVEEEIKNIKNLLAQKANFTDIVHHVERKADREDIKELHCRFQQTSQHFYSKQLNQSINLSRIQKTQSASTRRIASITKNNNSRSAMGPQTSNNRTEKADIDSATKLFMCGMQGHVLDNRKNLSQNSNRRKHPKASTVIVSDFLL